MDINRTRNASMRRCSCDPLFSISASNLDFLSQSSYFRPSGYPIKSSSALMSGIPAGPGMYCWFSRKVVPFHHSSFL